MQVDADLFLQIVLVLLSVAGTLGIGAGARRVLSKDARDRAKNDAEEDYFATAIREASEDRDRWRKSAEEAWQRVRLLEVENAVCKLEFRQCRSQLRLQGRLVKRYPDLSFDFGSSEPGRLDAMFADTTPNDPPD